MPLSDFPCKYLGLPLSLKKQVQPIIDRTADQLPGWKADLMTRAGRRVQVQSVLTENAHLLSYCFRLSSMAIKVVNKIRRGFLWRGRKYAKRWSLSCGLGQSLWPTRAWRPGNFRFKNPWLVLAHEMGLAAENRTSLSLGCSTIPCAEASKSLLLSGSNF